MNDLYFNNIPILVDSQMRSDQAYIISANPSSPCVPVFPDLSDEERQVQAVADRLLDRSPGLTFAMLQHAADQLLATHNNHPTSIVMSPEVRRQYLKLINADQRFAYPTNPPIFGPKP